MKSELTHSLVEVVNGRRPFDQYEQPKDVVLALERGEYHLERSTTDPLRLLFLRCWDQQPPHRPLISEVLQILTNPHLLRDADPHSLRSSSPGLLLPETVTHETGRYRPL